VQEDDLNRRKVNGVGVVKRGRGRPFTLFAPGGQGDDLETRMWYADQVKGTKIGFAYEDSEYFEPLARIRRQAERDAAEARAVASDHHVTQAIGFSRGARAVVGALAEDPDLFKRVALVIPPGGSAAGKYSDWLSSLTSAGRREMAAEILVVGNRGDQGHPARVAQTWAEQLGAQLVILPSRAVYTEPERVTSLLSEFFADPNEDQTRP
jgi:dienelactone hydrolase